MSIFEINSNGEVNKMQSYHNDSGFTLSHNGVHSKSKKFCGWTYVLHSCINKVSLFDTQESP